MGDYQDKKVDELQEELRDRGLPVSGTKDELIDRLQEADAVDAEDEETEEPAPKTQRVVVYKGLGVRKITEDDWKAVNVEHGELVWDARHGGRNGIPVKDIKLTPLQFQEYIGADPELEVRDLEV